MHLGFAIDWSKLGPPLKKTLAQYKSWTPHWSRFACVITYLKKCCSSRPSPDAVEGWHGNLTDHLIEVHLSTLTSLTSPWSSTAPFTFWIWVCLGYQMDPPCALVQKTIVESKSSIFWSHWFEKFPNTRVKWMNGMYSGWTRFIGLENLSEVWDVILETKGYALGSWRVRGRLQWIHTCSSRSFWPIHILAEIYAHILQPKEIQTVSLFEEWLWLLSECERVQRESPMWVDPSCCNHKSDCWSQTWQCWSCFETLMIPSTFFFVHRSTSSCYFDGLATFWVARAQSFLTQDWHMQIFWTNWTVLQVFAACHD